MSSEQSLRLEPSVFPDLHLARLVKCLGGMICFSFSFLAFSALDSWSIFVDSGYLCPCSLCCEVWPGGVVWLGEWMWVNQCSLGAKGVHGIKYGVHGFSV